jgi:hypothetical protein
VINFAFFLSIFSSCSWFIFCYIYINDKLHGLKFINLGVIDVLVFTTIIVMPILIIWIVFGHIGSFLGNRTAAKRLNAILETTKRNQEYSDLIARALIQNDSDIKAGFILSKFDLYVSEMNEIIAEIVKQLGTSEQKVNDAWARSAKGEKWVFGKILLEISGKSPKFAKDLIHMIKVDDSLTAPIIKYCAYYKIILAAFEKHDKDRFFLNIIENGVLGNINTLLYPAYDTVKVEEEIKAPVIEPKFEAKKEAKPSKKEEPLQVSSNANLEEGKNKWMSKIFDGKKEEEIKASVKEAPVIDRDSFYMFAAKTKKDDEIRKDPFVSGNEELNNKKVD